jgi:hypothetical protein
VTIFEIHAPDLQRRIVSAPPVLEPEVIAWVEEVKRYADHETLSCLGLS